MERPKEHWPGYHEATKDKPPRESLVNAIRYVHAKHNALDLGAGALNESKFLLQEGFEHVVAVDGEPKVQAAAERVGDQRLEVIVSEFEDFNFPVNSFDLVNAQFSLPFVRPGNFDDVFNKLKRSLKINGVFVGQLFGKHDDWSNNTSMTFHTADEVQKLLSDMQTIQCNEVEKDETAKDGNQKHWHVFHIIARKS